MFCQSAILRKETTRVVYILEFDAKRRGRNKNQIKNNYTMSMGVHRNENLIL